jgi:hypothetical protein
VKERFETEREGERDKERERVCVSEKERERERMANCSIADGDNDVVFSFVGGIVFSTTKHVFYLTKYSLSLSLTHTKYLSLPLSHMCVY